MKNLLFSSTAVMLMSLFIQPLNLSTKVSNLPGKRISPVAPMCGSSYTFYNGGSQTVSTVEIHKPGQPVLVFNNPSFPLNVATPYSGAMSIVIYFSSSGNGTIKLVNSNDLNVLACETFQNPALSPLYFTADCIDYHVIINDDQYCN